LLFHTGTSSLEKKASMPKVLIVDDDAEIRAVLATFLSDTGYPVWQACDGQEALEVLRHEQGWVIFLDWNMPRLDGAGVLEQLADNPALREGNRVIVMSATLGFRLEQLRRFAGVVAATVAKPFDLDEVLALVQTSSRHNQRTPDCQRSRTTRPLQESRGHHL
jgi:CheY-like chemotaxis protein